MVWLEAKHEYFENQDKYDKRQGTKIVKLPGITDDKKWSEQTKSPAVVVTTDKSAKKIKEIVTGEKKRKTMTIGDTKLGVTVVLDHEDCKELGFSPDDFPRQVIDKVRQKLGLKSREDKKKSRRK